MGNLSRREKNQGGSQLKKVRTEAGGPMWTEVTLTSLNFPEFRGYFTVAVREPRRTRNLSYAS